ncbi:hypothetical protein WCP94_003416 [Bilophila wadsworthia]
MLEHAKHINIGLTLFLLGIGNAIPIQAFGNQMTDSLRAYARVEREEGNSYTKDLGVSVGLRYAF